MTERTVLGQTALGHEFGGRRLAEPVFDALCPGHDDPLPVDQRGDPVRRQIALGQEAAQRRDVEPDAQAILERSAACHRRGHPDELVFEDGADEQIGDRRPARVERVADHVETAREGQRSAEGAQEIDELLAGEIHEVDRDPTRMARQHPLRLGVEPPEVPGIEMLGGRERPQRRQRRDQFTIDGHGERPRGVSKSALHGGALLALEDHDHESCKDQHGDHGGKDQERQMKPEGSRSRRRLVHVRRSPSSPHRSTS